MYSALKKDGQPLQQARPCRRWWSARRVLLLLRAWICSPSSRPVRPWPFPGKGTCVRTLVEDLGQVLLRRAVAALRRTQAGPFALAQRSPSRRSNACMPKVVRKRWTNS